MTSTRKFPWVWASLFLLIGIAGLVSYDVSRAGGDFSRSTTGRFMNDVGVLEHSERAWQKALSNSARGYLWLETNAPLYYAQAVQACAPYAQLSRDLAVVVANKVALLYANVRGYVVEKTPVVVAAVDRYAPGLVENVRSYASAAVEFVKKHSNDYYQLSADYLKTQVFVGEWAPEILHSKTETALNATRARVATYLLWVRERAHAHSKIP